LDIGSLIVYVAGTGLSLALVYYGLRTLKPFKGNVAGRTWTYISLSSVFFGVGVVTFLMDAISPIGLVAAGGVLQTVGAFFLFLGLRRTISSGRARITSRRTRFLTFLLLDRLFYIWKRLTEEPFVLILENIRRVESFSLE